MRFQSRKCVLIFGMGLMLQFLSFSTSAQSLEPFPTITMDVKELRLSGDPASTTGAVAIYGAPYTPFSFWGAPPTLNLGTPAKDAMFRNILSMVAMDRDVVVDGDIGCSVSGYFSICWRYINEVTY